MYKAVILFLILFISCKTDKKIDNELHKIFEVKRIKDSINNVLELEFVFNKEYPKGDVRRYGILPNHGFGKNPRTGNNLFEDILDLAEKINLEISFPEGYFPATLNIIGRKNLKIKFNNTSFGGSIKIFERDSIYSQNIRFQGKVSCFDFVLIRNAKKIKFDVLQLLSDPNQSTTKGRSRGMRIYKGVEDLKIDKIYIEDFGSGSEVLYQRNHAAILAIEGPKELLIEEIHIKSSDRHGIYLTGSDHIIGKIKIDNFGVGSIEEMANMPDVIYKNESKKIAGVWLSRCTNSFIEKIEINISKTKGMYSVRLDNGNSNEPTIIEEISIIGPRNSIPIFTEDNTNVIVKSLKE